MAESRIIQDDPIRDDEPLLHKAHRITTEGRRDEYGHPADNFAQIAAEWSLELGVKVTAIQVAMCMIRLKLVRLRHNPKHEDSWLDIAGYVNCANMVNQGKGDNHAT